jgi:DNA-3-methyladenine glycosylase I
MVKRCGWAKTDLSIAYHDHEWGVPVHDDPTLFEFLILEGAQAGLSWEIILRKREGYRAAFSGFDPEKVARYTARKCQALQQDERIIRNRLKIAAAVQNARLFLATRDEFGSFDKYIWQFVGGVTKRRTRGQDLQTHTVESDAMSRDLRGRGFKFVGSTICYSFMQAVGLVNDHNTDCFRYRQLA